MTWMYLVKIINGAIISIAGFFIIKKTFKSNVSILSIKSIGLLMVLVLTSALLHKLEYNFTITIINLIFSISIYKFIFNIYWSRSIIINFFFVVALFISEIIMLILTSFIGLSIYDVRSNALIFLIINFLIVINSVFLINLKFSQNIINRSIKWFRKKIYFTFVVASILDIIAIAFLLNKLSFNQGLDANLLTNVFLSVIFLILIYIFYKEKDTQIKLEREYDSVMQYVSTLEKCMDNYRIERHENTNQLLTIKSMVNNNVKKATEYINSVLNEPEEEENKWVNKLIKIPSGGLKGLLYYKLLKMKEANIETNISVSNNLTLLNFEKIDIESYKKLCRMVGVFLDNAIEAAAACKNKKIGIEFYTEEKEIVLRISNTFEGKMESSKKGKGRGFGLRLVKKILSSSTAFSHKKAIINDYYTQMLKIKIEPLK